MAASTISINKSLIPYTFTIDLTSGVYDMRIDYNSVGDFFTVELTKDGNTLCSGEPLKYGKFLFSDVRNTDFPAIDIVPYDESGKNDVVTYDNLGSGVLLIVDDGEISVLEG